MRIQAVLPLIIVLGASSCGDPGGPSPAGTLVVSVSTAGTDPDRDGYLLTLDGVSSVALDPADTVRIDMPSGSHRLELEGVADHCLVAPGAPLEVNVPARSTALVSFEVSCRASGARVTVRSTGVDLDGDGYRLIVDGSDRGMIAAIATIVVRLGPGQRTIALQGLASNCSLDGPGSRTVVIPETDVVPIDFAVVCTATTGVIAVLPPENTQGIEYTAQVDGGIPFPVGTGQPGYKSGVAPGTHVVTLTAPLYCTVDEPTRSVTVVAGGPVRDTVEVTFSVRCEPTGFRITAPTTGPIPDRPYSVWICDTGWYCYYNGPSFLGNVAPNGTLLAPVSAGLSYYLELRDVPDNCLAEPSSTGALTVTFGGTVNVEFRVTCSP